MNNDKDKDLTIEDLNKTHMSNDEEINTLMDINIPNPKISQELIGFFSLKGRSRRLDFFKIHIMTLLFTNINAVYFLPIASEEYIEGFQIISRTLLTILIMPITIRRLHDSNVPGMYSFLSLLPIVLLSVGYVFFDFLSIGVSIYCLYLLYRSGDPHPNDYGSPDPSKKYGNKAVNLICIFLFIMIIISGILVTI